MNKGAVTFQQLTEVTSSIRLQLTYFPEGVVETIGDRWGTVASRVHGALERFKAFIEARD